MSEDSETKISSQSNLEQQLEAEKKRSEEYLTRYQYLQADFDNFRKRCDRQIQQATAYSSERLAMQLLDVADELEMAIKTAEKVNASDPLVVGVQMTLKRLRKVLEQEGVCAIESEGKAFDPSKHNAIAAVEAEGVDGCVVLEEIRKGYIMKEKIIRPSIVKVAVKPNLKSQNKEEKASE
jgi:molecular chaperone GrpE